MAYIYASAEFKENRQNKATNTELEKHSLKKQSRRARAAEYGDEKTEETG